MRVHEATARTLRDNGVGTVFGLLGDANLFMVRSFVDDQGGRFIAATHEMGATLMAAGYAAATGKPGVASVTHGPGLTNTLTGLVDAVKAELPLLLICGDTPADNKGHFQNVNQREFVLASGAGFEQARTPQSVSEDLLNALRRCIEERKPVALNIPADFEWVEVEYEPRTLTAPKLSITGIEGEELDNAVGMIAAARAPIVLAGRGACDAETEKAIRHFAERAGAVLATTLKGKGLFHGDPYNLGVFGTLSTDQANEIILQSDCVIAFGASLNQYTSGQGSLLDGKRLIQCNAEASQVARYRQPDAALVGNLAAIASTLQHWLDEAEIPSAGFRRDEVREALASVNIEVGLPDTATESTVDLTRALLRINEAVPEDRFSVSDVGRFVGQAWKAIDVSVPRGLIHTVNFGSIGLSLPYALGAQVAFPERCALVVTGDGGFMLGGLTEFHTAVREGADVIVVVCNDSSYGAEYVQFESKNLSTDASLFTWPEFAEVARALGGTGVTVRNGADLDTACEAIAARDRPLLIDLKLDPARMIPLDY
jgi:acetolactate synthase-1/2/3 large subunit